MQQPQTPNPFGFRPFRGIVNGFIAGLVVGMLIGWFFHGLVGLVVRLGFALLLLVPLAIVIWYFFLRRRVRQASEPTADRGGMQVFTWDSARGTRRYTADPRPPGPPGPPEAPEPSTRPRRADEVIDIEFEELKRQVDDGERRH